MVDTSKLPEVERQHLLGKELNPLPMVPLVEGPPLSERRIAIITTAGLHRIDDERFNLVDVSYRVLPSDVKTGDLSMTHSSVHFDRTGFREDINLVYPVIVRITGCALCKIDLVVQVRAGQVTRKLVKHRLVSRGEPGLVIDNQ